MQLNLNKSELLDLMEMASLATAIAATDADEGDMRFTAWTRLQNRIFDLAAQHQELAPLIGKHPGTDREFTQDYVDKAYFTEKLNDFSEHIFWSDLVARLADKALEEHMGQSRFNALSEEERREIAEPLEKSLWNECSLHGIERLGFILPPTDA